MGVKYSDVIERMRWAGKLKNDSAVARALGVTPQALSSCKRRGELPANLLFKFSQIFSISLDWLLTGKAPVYKGQGENEAILAPTAASAYALPAARRSQAKRFIGFTALNDEEAKYVNRLIKVLRSGNKKETAAIRDSIDAFLRSTEERGSVADSA